MKRLQAEALESDRVSEDDEGTDESQDGEDSEECKVRIVLFRWFLGKAKYNKCLVSHTNASGGQVGRLAKEQDPTIGASRQVTAL